MNEEYEKIEKLLEELDETCFPFQMNWNNKDLYLKGLSDALTASGLQLVKIEK